MKCTNGISMIGSAVRIMERESWQHPALLERQFVKPFLLTTRTAFRRHQVSPTSQLRILFQSHQIIANRMVVLNT